GPMQSSPRSRATQEYAPKLRPNTASPQFVLTLSADHRFAISSGFEKNDVRPVSAPRIVPALQGDSTRTRARVKSRLSMQAVFVFRSLSLLLSGLVAFRWY